MNNIWICVTLCAFALVVRGDDKQDLIDAITGLESKIKSLDEQLVDFENQIGKTISNIKTQFDKSVSDVKEAEKKVDAKAKNGFCDAKATDLDTYNTSVNGKIADGQKAYDTDVKDVKDNNKGTLASLENTLKDTKACKDTDKGCIPTQKNSFSVINDRENKRLDNDKKVVTDSITQFTQIIDTAAKEVAQVIPDKESDAVTCFNKLVLATEAIDKFTVDVNKVIKNKTDDLISQKNVSSSYVNAIINALDTSFAKIIDDHINEINKKKDAADKKQADVTTCELDKVQTTLNEVRKTLVDLFTKNTASYPTKVQKVVDQAVSSINQEKNASDDIFTQLKNCKDVACIDGISTVCNNEYKTVNETITGKESDAQKKILGYQSDITTMVKTTTSNCNQQIDAKTNTVTACITTQINKADIKSIREKAVDANIGIGVKITELKANLGELKSKWLNDLSTDVDKLENYLGKIIDNVTSYEHKAISNAVEIKKCLANENVLYKNVLTTLISVTKDKIDLHYNEVDKVTKELVKQAQDCYAVAYDIVDLVGKCKEDDSGCIADAQTQCDKKISELTAQEKSLTDTLAKQIDDSDKAMKTDAAGVYMQATKLADDTGAVIIKCIKTQIENSALSFSPSLILLIVGFLTQIYFNS